MPSKKILPKRSQALFPVWEQGMNAEQLLAINHDEGPARVFALAGSGKTRANVHRIARLVHHGVAPDKILAITFSKKAAEEMASRIMKLDVENARVGTWHSVCLEIIRQDRAKGHDWEISSSAERELKDVVGYKNMNWKGADINAISSFIGHCKANLYDPNSEGAIELATRLMGSRDARLANEAFERYNALLEDKCILTFDDMIVFAAKHLSVEENRRHWSRRYEFIIQDEAQDENLAQNTVVRLLARDHRNYMAIGDPWQSIYSFRGSSPQYFMDFPKQWEGAVTYELPRNYRSGTKIIEAANGVLRNARVSEDQPKQMIAERKLEGKAEARAHEDFDDEARSFASWITSSIKTGDARVSDFCALYRTNAQSRALEEALLAAKLPYVVVGGVSFYERKEVRDLLGYLRIAAGRGELADVKRCINAPFRFLGMKFVERVQSEAMKSVDAGGDLSTIEWTRLIHRVSLGSGIQGRQRDSAAEWASIVVDASTRIAKATNAKPGDLALVEGRPSSILEDIIRRTQYIAWLTKEEGQENIESSGAANVRELVRVSERFTSVGDFIDYIDATIRASEVQRNDKQAGGKRVLLMNIHRSKGLEWPCVWVAGFNELVFPHKRADLQEERRLAYVAITRARDAVVLSHVRTIATRAGIIDSPPSRFLVETGLASIVKEEPEVDGGENEALLPIVEEEENEILEVSGVMEGKTDVH